MPTSGTLPHPRDNQRLTVRFLHAPLDVEHEGDVVTMYDSARRHPGMRNRIGLWIAMMLGGMGVVCVLLLIGVQPATLTANLELGGAAVVLLGLAFCLLLLARVPVERRLTVDLRSGVVRLRWPDSEMTQWTGDVDGLRLLVCPMEATGPGGIVTVARGCASVAVLDGTATPMAEAIFDCGPLTRAVLRTIATISPRSTPRNHTNQGWIVLATGEDPDALEAELREALPTLTRVIEVERTEETLTGPVDAKLLRKPKPREH